MYNAQGVIKMHIKPISGGTARRILASNAQNDIERRHLDDAKPSPFAPQILEGVSATISDQQDLLQSMGTVLDKIKVIANVTATALDTLAKVSLSL